MISEITKKIFPQTENPKELDQVGLVLDEYILTVFDIFNEKYLTNNGSNLSDSKEDNFNKSSTEAF